MSKKYKILLIGGLLCNFAENLLGPFYVVFIQGIGADILTIGYLQTTYLILTGILIIIMGTLSDKLKKEWFLVIGYFLFALNSLSYLFITETWQLFIMKIVVAIATALIASPLMALMAENIKKGKEGLQWAIQGGGDKIILGLSVLTGTFLVNYFGFKILFLIMFFLNITVVILQLNLIFNPKIKSENQKTN